jgi:hypothetical protein
VRESFSRPLAAAHITAERDDNCGQSARRLRSAAHEREAESERELFTGAAQNFLSFMARSTLQASLALIIVKQSANLKNLIGGLTGAARATGEPGKESKIVLSGEKASG